jgi:hypothetical protein
MSGTNANSIARVYDSLQGRNRIINGACNVAQRGSFVASTGLNGYGGPDRYKAINLNSAGGQFTQAQGTITIGGVAKNAIVQTVNTAISSTTGTNAWSGISQYIEGFNAFDFLGQQVSVSFIFNTNVSGTYSLVLADGTSTNSYVTSFIAVANTPTRYTFLISTLPTSLGIPNSSSAGFVINIGSLNTGTFQTSTLNAWQSGNFISVPGATNWGASSSNFIAVTELQIEQCTIATPFEREGYSITLAKCQRYYEVISAFDIQLGGYGLTGNVFPFAFPYKVTKRATPTIVLGSLTATNATLSGSPASSVGTLTYSVSVTATGAYTFQYTTASTSNAEL